MFRKRVVHGLDGAAEARCLRAPDSFARQKFGDGGFQMPHVLRIARVFEVVDSAAIEQHAVRVNQKRPRSLLGGPLPCYETAPVVSDRKMDTALRHSLANLLRRLSGS